MNLPFSTSVSKRSKLDSGSIFIDMDANKKEVEKLLSDKRSIERRLDDIQSKCKHKNKVLKQVQVGNGSELRWLCEDCNLAMGWPTSAEQETFFK
tara:strand:- start:593 stop:877 length:285 start_codon:yes stop_codon:yes gene_type:complete